jgi:hypothetical protein
MLVFLFYSDDKLTRVQPLIDHVRRVSQDIFQPYEKIAIYERMVRSKHKFSGIRQCMKNKPVKFGIKLWVLADTITGYTSIVLVYLGEKELRLLIFQKIYHNYAVVFNLLPESFIQGYRLFMDSFYTTYKLLNDLFKKQVYVIGAGRSNSSAMPTV